MKGVEEQVRWHYQVEEAIRQIGGTHSSVSKCQKKVGQRVGKKGCWV